MLADALTALLDPALLLVIRSPTELYVILQVRVNALWTSVSRHSGSLQAQAHAHVYEELLAKLTPALAWIHAARLMRDNIAQPHPMQSVLATALVLLGPHTL
jgi:hypothetical protein